MKVLLGALSALMVLSSVSAQHCYKDVNNGCKTTGEGSDFRNCNALYSGFPKLVDTLQNYACRHIELSYDHLMMATHFNSYQKNRDGFYKLFRGLSDSAWEKSIELIKYIAKRGGDMNTCLGSTIAGTEEVHESQSWEQTELGAMARALDTYKSVAEEAHKIHRTASRRSDEYHDAEVSSFIEEHFVHKQSELVRRLSGYTNDLKKLVGSNDHSLALYLFDEYLQKV